jgi:hypothetical protein
MKLFPYDPSDTYKNMISGKPASLIFCPKLIMKVQAAQTMPIIMGPHYCKALASNIYYERLSSYFVFWPHYVIQNTMKQTTQLTKSTINHPMRRLLNLAVCSLVMDMR